MYRQAKQALQIQQTKQAYIGAYLGPIALCDQVSTTTVVMQKLLQTRAHHFQETGAYLRKFRILRDVFWYIWSWMNSVSQYRNIKTQLYLDKHCSDGIDIVQSGPCILQFPYNCLLCHCRSNTPTQESLYKTNRLVLNMLETPPIYLLNMFSYLFLLKLATASLLVTDSQNSLQYMQLGIKTSGSESQGQEEAVCSRVFRPTQPLQ